MNMHCIYCGKELEEERKVCPNCGKILVSSDERKEINKEETEYIGFWKRFCAYIIDCAVLSFIGFMIGFLISFISIVLNLDNEVANIFYSVIGIITAWLYFAGMESSKRQATIGKTAMGIKVINQEGARISFLKASVRYFSKILSGMIFCIGYIMVSFTKKRQALHDIIAGTYVVQE